MVLLTIIITGIGAGLLILATATTAINQFVVKEKYSTDKSVCEFVLKTWLCCIFKEIILAQGCYKKQLHAEVLWTNISCNLSEGTHLCILCSASNSWNHVSISDTKSEVSRFEWLKVCCHHNIHLKPHASSTDCKCICLWFLSQCFWISSCHWSTNLDYVNLSPNVCSKGESSKYTTVSTWCIVGLIW